MSALRIKICGVRTIADAEACVAAGADMIGVNLVPSSPRRVEILEARAIARALKGAAIVVGVMALGARASLSDLERIRDEAELDKLQLHGDEPLALAHAAAAFAFKAVRIGSEADVAYADGFPGLLLLDAKVEGALGGTGRRIDPALVAPIARRREVLLAGGLDASNVADAVRAIAPWGVDVASGVESAPGVKDRAKVRAFIEAARPSP